MKIFSSETYEFTLPNNDTKAWGNLRNNIKISTTLSTIKTDKAFIGIIQEQSFRLISSVPGKGALCVLTGNINATTGNLIISSEIHKAFRILISIWLLLVVGVFIFLLFTTSFLTFLEITFGISIMIFALKFIVFNYAFKTVSRKTLNNIIEVMDLKEVLN